MIPGVFFHSARPDLLRLKKVKHLVPQNPMCPGSKADAEIDISILAEYCQESVLDNLFSILLVPYSMLNYNPETYQ